MCVSCLLIKAIYSLVNEFFFNDGIDLKKHCPINFLFIDGQITEKYSHIHTNDTPTETNREATNNNKGRTHKQQEPQ